MQKRALWLLATAIALSPFGIVAWQAYQAQQDLSFAGDIALIDSTTGPLPVFYPRGANAELIDTAHDLARILSIMSGGQQVRAKPEPWFSGQRGIYLGDTKLAQHYDANLPDINSYEWRSVGRSLILRGQDATATAIAAYKFLQTFANVRWYIPTELGEEIPVHDAWSIPQVNDQIQPYWKQRFLTLRGDEATQLWALRNGLRQRYASAHALHHYIRAEHFEEHPELFPLVDGKPYRPTTQSNWQPNLAHPKTAQWVADAVLERMRQAPQPESLSIALNDIVFFGEVAPDLISEHEGLPDYAPLAYRFSNTVAQKVAQEYPDLWLVTHAYYWWRQAPEFKLEPNLAPLVIIDSGKWHDEETKATDLRLLEEWHDSGVNQLGVYDYYYGADYWMPKIYPRTVGEAIRRYQEKGACFFFAEVLPRWGYDAVETWLAAQMLWDNQATADSLLDEFYAGYYGPAAMPMRQFFELCERRWLDQTEPARWLRHFRNSHQAMLYCESDLESLAQLIEEAKRLAKGNDRIRQRIALTQELLGETRLAQQLVSQRWELHDAPRDKLPALLQEHSDTVQSVEGINQQRNAGTGLNDWTHSVYFMIEDDPVPRRLAEWLWWNQGYDRTVLEPIAGDLLPRWKGMAEALQRAHASGLAGRERLQNGSFESEGVWAFAGADIPRETIQWRRGSAHHGQRSYRISGAYYRTVQQSVSVREGDVLVFSASLRGQVSPSSTVALYLEWLDAEGRKAGQSFRDRLPPGDFTKWQQLGGVARVGQGITHARLVFLIRHQEAGDWLELDSARVEALPTAPAAP